MQKSSDNLSSAPKNWLNKNILGFGLASFWGDFGYEIATAALPLLLVTLVGSAAAPQVLGFVSSISDGAASFLKIFSGWLSDRVPRRKPFLVLGYSLSGLFIGLIGTATTAGQIIAYRTCAWIGKGLREPPRDALIAESVQRQYYGRAFGFHRAMDTLGAILGPALMFFVLRSISLRSILFLTFIPGILSVLSILFLTTDPGRAQRHASSSGTALVQFRELPPSFLYFVSVALVFALGNFNKMLLILRAQELLSNLKIIGSSEKYVVVLYILFNCVRAISEYSIGLLSDYIGRKNLLAFLGYTFFGIVSLGLLSISNSLILLTGIFIMAGISAATVTALGKAYAADLLPAQARGTGYGVLQFIEGIGALVSSLIVGTLWSSLAPTAGFAYSAILSFLAAALLYRMPRSTSAQN